MPRFVSRRESLRAAFGAVLSPICACLGPACGTKQRAVADATPSSLTTTYRYDGQGRVLTVVTSNEPHANMS